MTTTFNKSNWTGEGVSITVVNNEFDLDGYRYRMVFEPKGEFELAKLYRLKGNGTPEEFPICVACHWKNEKSRTPDWEFFAWEIREGNLSRRHSDPFVAAAKVICNLV